MIKQISLSNYQEVVELFNLYRIFYQQPSDLSLADQFIASRLSRQESVMFAYYAQHEEAVAFVQLYPTFSSVRASKTWILNDLYVREDYRMKGIAEKLMRKAVQFAKEDGAVSITLETAKDNLPAKALYHKMGFEIAGANMEFDQYMMSTSIDQ